MLGAFICLHHNNIIHIAYSQCTAAEAAVAVADQTPKNTRSTILVQRKPNVLVTRIMVFNGPSTAGV